MSDSEGIVPDTQEVPDTEDNTSTPLPDKDSGDEGDVTKTDSSSSAVPKTPEPSKPAPPPATPRTLNIAEIAKKIGVSVSSLQSSYERSDRKLDLFTFIVRKAFETEHFIFDNTDLAYNLMCFPGDRLTRAHWEQKVVFVPTLCDRDQIGQVFDALAPSGEMDAKVFQNYVSTLNKALHPSGRVWDIARKKAGELMKSDERLLVVEDFVNHKTYFPGRQGTLLLTDRNLIHVAQTVHTTTVVPLERITKVRLTSQGGMLKKGMQMEIDLEAGDWDTIAHEDHEHDARVTQKSRTLVFLFSSMREAVKGLFKKGKAEIHRIHVFHSYLEEVLAGRKLALQCEEKKGNHKGLFESIVHSVIVADVIHDIHRSDVRSLLARAEERSEELLERFKDTRQWFDRSKVFTHVLPPPPPDASDVEFDIKLFAQHIDAFLTLIEPVVVAFHLWDDLIQWHNPQLTAIVGAFCLLLSILNLTSYIPMLLFMAWALFIYQLRLVKLDDVCHRKDRKEMEKEKIASGLFGGLRLKLYKLHKVQNGLQRTQNKLFEVNVFLKKLTNVHMWTERWQSQTAMTVLGVLAFVFFQFSFRVIWAVLVVFFFTKRFRNPEPNIFERAVIRFWAAVPPVEPVNEIIDPKKDKGVESKKTK